MMIRANYRHHLELERDISRRGLDVDGTMVLNSMFERLHEIVEFADSILRHSLLKHQQFNLSMSMSFQTAFYRPTQSSCSPDKPETY